MPWAKGIPQEHAAMSQRSSAIVVLLASLIWASPLLAQDAPDAKEVNRMLGRGINLGNALDAPTEGEWGVTLEESYFQTIRDAGFDSVRIPVRFSAHALTEAPYTIDAAFMDRVAWAVDQAVARKLAVVLNTHHYAAIYDDPEAQTKRMLGMREQIAGRFRDTPPTVVFEILNQPTGRLGEAKWNALLRQALAVIRRSNPTRIVMIGPAGGNRPDALPGLDLPDDDRRIIVTVHYYSPDEFTNQGAAWVEGADKWLGMKWTGSDAEKQAINRDLDVASAWAKEHDRPMHLGEFGVYEAAEMDSRARWAGFMVEQCIQRGWAFHYWEFCSGFGAYDPQARQWRKPLLDALVTTGR
jgi:endoglucanase